MLFVQENVRMSAIFRTATKRFVRVDSWKLIFGCILERNRLFVQLQVCTLFVYCPAIVSKCL